MKCPRCQHENIPTAKFCSECAAKLRAVCPQCGTEAPPTAKFCHECAAPLTAAPSPAPPVPAPSLEAQFTALQQAMPASFREQVLTRVEGENRLVTVLFADMSRSVQTTADLAPDEGAALVSSLLKAMVDVLLRYEGRVDRFLGDGLLAVFGTPQAHESDPERAILAAMEIREAARGLGLEVTAGINTGEVYVGGVGSEQHQEVTVMGPVVNLASRLQGQAEPGQILVGETTYRLTRRAFTFSPLSLDVKGLAQPVTAHAVERALPRPEKARGIEGLRAELIGRDDELAQLREALAEVMRGRGQMVALIGEAGVGKSRLVSELKALTTAHPSSVMRHSSGPPPDTAPMTNDASRMTNDASRPLWLEGRCLELGMTASYWLFVDLFRDYFAFAPEEDERERGARLVADLQALVDRGDLSQERLEEIGPLFGNLMSVRFGTDWDERLKNAGPEQIKHQTFMAIRDLLATLAQRQPVILALEDLHWADSLSLDLISLLMETLTRDPLLLLCVYRPEREHKCWHLGTIASRKCPERHTEISLRELTPQQSRRLVEALLTIENLPTSVKELIQEKARGNPFFVEEVVRSLIASGMVYQEGAGTHGAAVGAWRAKEGIESVTVPESIQSVILSRVDRLERKLRGVLESASVIGRLFRRRLLEYTTQGTTELGRSLWELEDQALIYQERVVPEEEYSFKHVLMQETIYQSILRRRRTGFHQKVAEAMEALYREGLDEYYEQLAYHYERSGVNEKAVEYQVKAGEKARRAYLNEAAIGYFRRALQRLGESALGEMRNDWRLAALKGLGQVYHGMGEELEAEDCFRQAIDLGQQMDLPARERVRLHYWLGDVLFWQSRHAEMVPNAEEGLALLGSDTESMEAALMNMQLGRYLHTAEFAERLPYSEELRPVYSCIGRAYAGDVKETEEALRWFRSLEMKAEQNHDLRAKGDVQFSIADAVLVPSGDLRGALLQYRRAMDVMTTIGDLKHVTFCQLRMGDTFLAMGDFQSAEEWARRGMEGAQHVGRKSDIARSRTTLATVLLSLGSFQEAEDLFRLAAHDFREIGWGGPWTHAAIGRVCLARDRKPEAREKFHEALVMMSPDAHEWWAAHPIALALSGLEEASDHPDEFRSFCQRYREENAGASEWRFAQWFLESANRSTFSRQLFRSEFASSGSMDWIWHDPFADCSFEMEHGLAIHAANGRDLWRINLSAPRLLRPITGSFAVQTVCAPASEDKPAIGGLLLWRDKANYLRLDRGTRGKHEISFQGCLHNEDMIIGRGRLPAERIFLRLERLDGHVNALCSADGEAWFTAGQVEFPVEDPVEVGLQAIGNIDRIIYPGAYADGTAIRFESFEVWGD